MDHEHESINQQFLEAGVVHVGRLYLRCSRQLRHESRLVRALRKIGSWGNNASYVYFLPGCAAIMERGARLGQGLFPPQGNQSAQSSPPVAVRCPGKSESEYRRSRKRAWFLLLLPWFPDTRRFRRRTHRRAGSARVRIRGRESSFGYCSWPCGVGSAIFAAAYWCREFLTGNFSYIH